MPKTKTSKPTHDARGRAAADKILNLPPDESRYMVTVLEVLACVGASYEGESALMGEVACRQPWMLDVAAGSSLAVAA